MTRACVRACVYVCVCVCVEQLDENLLLWIIETWDCDTIRITCPCALYPLAPHLHIVKLGFTWVYNCLIIRDVKSCKIRHPEVRIKYPDTSEGSHRITSYIWDHVCMVYVRPYCSISDHIVASMLFL